MSRSQKGIVWTVAGLLGVVACIAGFYIGSHVYLKQHVNQGIVHGTQLDKPRQVAAFALEGIDNKPFTNQSLSGHWTMMFFGFTHCGYLCPTTMAELAKMYRLLEEQKTSQLPQVVMISLDPFRDDLVRLGNYVKAFDPHFYGARGDTSAITAMTRDLGIAYTKVIRNNQDNTQQDDIDHSGAIMVFNPEGHLMAFFTPPHTAEDMASDYLLLINQGNLS